MHAYTELVTEQMKEKGLDRPAVVSASGLSRQVVHNIVTDKRERLTAPPEERTVLGLAKALTLPPEVIWAAVGVAMGLPAHVVPAVTHQIKDATNEQLVAQLAARLGLEVSVRPASKEDEGQKTERVKEIEAESYRAPKPSATKPRTSPSDGT